MSTNTRLWSSATLLVGGILIGCLISPGLTKTAAQAGGGAAASQPGGRYQAMVNSQGTTTWLVDTASGDTWWYTDNNGWHYQGNPTKDPGTK